MNSNSFVFDLSKPRIRYCVEHVYTRKQIGRLCRNRRGAEGILARLCDACGIGMMDFYTVRRVRVIPPEVNHA